MATATTIQESAAAIDLSSRIVASKVVVASPAAGTETIIASLTIPAGLQIVTGVLLVAQCAFTVGTSGVSVNLKIRRTDTSGATVTATGATTAVATNLGALTVAGIDTAVPDGQLYVATLLVGSGAASSAVSEVLLLAIAI